MRKTCLILLMIFILAIGLPVCAAAVSTLPLAEPEDGISWEMKGTTLEISGTGEITGQNWSSLVDTVTAVVIHSGVTGIGEEAFSGFHALKSVLPR